MWRKIMQETESDLRDQERESKFFAAAITQRRLLKSIHGRIWQINKLRFKHLSVD